jgi:hypothetical protein
MASKSNIGTAVIPSPRPPPVSLIVLGRREDHVCSVSDPFPMKSLDKCENGSNIDPIRAVSSICGW